MLSARTARSSYGSSTAMDCEQEENAPQSGAGAGPSAHASSERLPWASSAPSLCNETLVRGRGRSRSVDVDTVGLTE